MNKFDSCSPKALWRDPSYDKKVDDKKSNDYFNVSAQWGFLIHRRRAQIFDQIFDQGFWPGFFGQKKQCTIRLGRRNTVYSTTGTENLSFTVLPGRRNT